MTKETIVGRITVKGSNEKLEVGREDANKPDTHKEALEVWGNDKRIIALAWRSHVIDRQAALKAGSNLSKEQRAKDASNKQVLANAAESGDSKKLDALRELGLI